MLKELSDLVYKGKNCTSQADLELVEEEFRKLHVQYPHEQDIGFHYNEFRIGNAAKLPRTRPQILLGGPLALRYPNLHSYPLFWIADVVCITCTSNPPPFHSAIHCNPFTLFSDILKRLPKGFEPDFFWDNQIEHHHFIPQGIEMAPFPIIASVCHTYLHKSVEHVCELFDRVIAMSKFHAQILRKKYPEKILELPFGLNWASFDYVLQPCSEKFIDVCLTFKDDNSPVIRNKRNRIIELAKNFREKYGNRFVIQIVSGLPLETYMETLRRSRITINATGIHGPYNYRTVEAMCSGSMVFQYDWSDDDFFENNFSELFIDGVHGVTFNFDNFESKLLHYLENPKETEKIARSGYQYLADNYNYKNLYQQLISEVKNCNIERPRINQNLGYHHADMIYYNQNNDGPDYMSYGVINDFNGDSWIKTNNLMVLSRTLQDQYLGHHLLAALAYKENILTGKGDSWTLCCRFHEKALTTTPKEHVWIIHWNFLLLSLEQNTATKVDIANVATILEGAVPTAFDEDKLIFKYYVRSTNYPEYQIGKTNKEFIVLNIELMKIIDQPHERALLYHQYALKAVKYFSCR